MSTTLEPGEERLLLDEPLPPERTYRLMLRLPSGIEHFADLLTNRQAEGLAACGLGLVTPEDLGVPIEPEQ